MDYRPADIILKLLHQYECVVLPGLGGFVTEPIKAAYDPVAQALSPPSLRVMFNHHLNRNDGLLLQAWCEVHQVSIIQASEDMKHWIDSIKLKLKNDGHFDLGTLGSFVMDVNGKTSFAFVNPTLSAGYGFGLKPLHLRKLNTLKETPVIELRSINQDESVITKNSQWKKWAAAAAIILPLGFYSWWIPTQTHVMESGHLSINDLNPFKQNKATIKSYQKRSSQFTFQEELLTDSEIKDGKIRIIYDQDVYLEVMVEAPIKPGTVEPAPLNSGYFLVTGCFREQANADRFVLEMTNKGLNAVLIDMNGGLYRVGIGGFENSTDAQAQMSVVKQAGYNSWILRK